MPPTLKRVVRLDSIPIRKAVFTDEGYLVDKPVLTTTGIFEYTNPDGSIRRELRLPEDVFAPESLASYKGKPVIITHDAGLVTKDNVHENQVGTILSEGIRDGDDVRAEIVIHDTDEMKDRGYKELSLGYNLDLEETPGEWRGEPYDAIQRNIIINHLALVREARAGEQARLNIDSRDSDTLKGGKSMKKTPKSVRGDGILSKEELEQAIKEYKARRAKEAENEKPVASEPKAPAPKEKAPENKPAPKEEVKPKEEEKPTFDEDVEAAEGAEPETVEAKIERVKENRNLRDEEGDPKDKLSAMGMIAHQDEDIDTLFDIIDTLLAEREFKMKKDSDDDAIPDRDKSGESVANCDSDDEEEEETFEFEEDEDDETPEEEEAEVEETEEFEEDEDDEDDEEDDESAYGDPEDDEDWDEDGDDEEDEDWDEEEEEEEEEEEFATDSHDSPIPDSTGEVHHVKKLNSDSVDAVINQRIELGMIGRKLNMDGLEKLGIMAAKRRIVKAVRPKLRLDGKSDAYVNAAYDCAVDEIRKRTHKGVKYQKKQMFNKDSRVREEGGTSSVDARRAMIERQINRNKIKEEK